MRHEYIYFRYTIFGRKVFLETGTTNELSMTMYIKKETKQEILPGRRKLYVRIDGESFEVKEY